MCLEAVEAKLDALGPHASRQATIEAIREIVVAIVESKVQEKTEELWTKGKQVLGTMSQKHAEKTQQLTDEVTACQERMILLSAENERLKQVLQSLANRFQFLGGPWGGKADTPLSPESTMAGLSPLMSHEDTPNSAFAHSLFSPYTPTMPSDYLKAKLPEVPAFPFPTPAALKTGGPPSPLSLAEALGSKSPPPQRTPLSLVQSLTSTPGPTPMSEGTTMPSPFTGGGRGGLVNGIGMFSFTLRKADGAELGLNVSHHEQDKVLRVEGVRPDGAVEAWNRQCSGSAFAEKAVLPGDKIICVNHIYYDPIAMLEECKDKQLLKLTVVRGEIPLPPAPPQALTGSPAAQKPAFGLNVNAATFVMPGSPATANEATTALPPGLTQTPNNKV